MDYNWIKNGLNQNKLWAKTGLELNENRKQKLDQIKSKTCELELG